MASRWSEPDLPAPEVVLAEVYERVAGRRRRARRQALAAVAAVVVAGVAVPVGLFADRGHKVRVTTNPMAQVTTTNPPVRVPNPPPPRPGGALPYWTPPPGPPVAAPAVFVDGDNAGGIGVYATATGRLIRTLHAQSGGIDQQPVLSLDRRTVYFAQPSGGQPSAPCAGAILGGPVSGASPPTVRISVAGTLALEPSPSPSGRYLAWVGVTCPTGRAKSTLFVTDLTTGAKTTLGAFSGDNSGDGIAWSPDGQRLAVEEGQTLVIADPAKPMSLTDARPIPVADGCTLNNPAFIPHSGELAAVQTCGGLTSSAALAFDPSSEHPTALIAVAPTGSRIASLSVDASGQHVLLGVGSAAGNASIFQVVGGVLALVGPDAPTAAEW